MNKAQLFNSGKLLIIKYYILYLVAPEAFCGYVFRYQSLCLSYRVINHLKVLLFSKKLFLNLLAASFLAYHIIIKFLVSSPMPNEILYVELTTIMRG